MSSIKFVLPCSVQATAFTSPEPVEYSLYPELPASISVCPCEIEFDCREWILSSVLKKGFFIF
jgi:hypothetical protein